MKVVELFRDGGVGGLKEAIHFEVLGIIGKNEIFCEHNLFPELKLDLAYRAMGPVECYEIDPVELRKYTTKENMVKTKDLAHARMAKFRKSSVFLGSAA